MYHCNFARIGDETNSTIARFRFHRRTLMRQLKFAVARLQSKEQTHFATPATASNLLLFYLFYNNLGFDLIVNQLNVFPRQYATIDLRMPMGLHLLYLP